jgi:hypothetical protein
MSSVPRCCNSRGAGALQLVHPLSQPLGAINSVFDLKGKKIGLLDNSVQASYFRNLVENSGIKVRLVPLHNLEAGSAWPRQAIDGIIASQQAGDMLADRCWPTPASCSSRSSCSSSADGARPGYLAAIDRYLSQWQADPGSIYFDILRKWGAATGILPMSGGCWAAPCSCWPAPAHCRLPAP